MRADARRAQRIYVRMCAPPFFFFFFPENGESGAPREADEVEAAMRARWTGPSPRSAEMVDWYGKP